MKKLLFAFVLLLIYLKMKKEKSYNDQLFLITEGMPTLTVLIIPKTTISITAVITTLMMSPL